MLINRAIVGYFTRKRDLYHGDPLSLILFIILAKALGKSIQVDTQARLIEGIKPIRDLLLVSYQ